MNGLATGLSLSIANRRSAGPPRVAHVSSLVPTAGNGTRSAPFKTLAAAVAALTPQSMTTKYSLPGAVSPARRGVWVDCGVLSYDQIAQAQIADEIHVYQGPSAPANQSDVYLVLPKTKTVSGDGTQRLYARAASSSAARVVVTP